MNQTILLGQAIALLQKGRAGEAAALCRERLLAHPRDAQSLHLLGVIALQTNDPDTGIDYLRRSLAVEPNQPFVHCNLGNALQESGRADSALACYERALQLMPGFVGAFYNQGNALAALDRTEEAIASFDRAIALEPGHHNAHNNRGNALFKLGAVEAALESYQRAIIAHPEFAAARSNYAHALRELGRLPEALLVYDRVLVSSPEDADVLLERARTLRGLRRNAEALIDLERAAGIQPGSVEIANLLAVVLRELARPEEAAAGFARLLQLAPHYPYALGNLLQARLQTCDWSDYTDITPRLLRAVSAEKRVCLPGPFLAVARSAAAQQECTRLFVADQHATPRAPLWRGERYGHGKIRVAYVSADFREHPVALLLAGVIEHHDRERFETVAVSLRAAPRGPFTARLERAFDRFIDAATYSDREVATRLRELEIDIAIDLTGFSGNARTTIFAHRPAPVQVNYLGYPATMGLPYIDYIIADRIVIPTVEHACYTEKVVYLPDSYQPGDATREIAVATPTRAECELPQKGFVFCCFNTHYKINPECFAVWMRVLGATPGSVLWLAQGSKTVEHNLRAAAARGGIAPERLVFAPYIANAAEHLARYRCADLFIDTLPFNAHATANDALWAGLPVLTCQGATFAGRVASSLLFALGLPELVTGTLEKYEAVARQLADEQGRLDELCARLHRNRLTLPLFDTMRYCRYLETAYSAMWERAERGEAPQHFAVARTR